MKYLMGIDEGTTGCKACLFTQDGQMVASASREYPSYYPQPGWVEQDIEEIKEAVFSSCREAIRKSGVNSQDIVGVSHSNQGITMVLLDEDQKPVMKHTIGWQDLRYVDMLPELEKEVDLDDYWKRSGMKFGTYNIHSAVGMSRKCQDLQVTVTPENPVVYTKVYIKPGFWANSFVVEYVDPKLLDL